MTDIVIVTKKQMREITRLGMTINQYMAGRTTFVDEAGYTHIMEDV